MTSRLAGAESGPAAPPPAPTAGTAGRVRAAPAASVEGLSRLGSEVCCQHLLWPGDSFLR